MMEGWAVALIAIACFLVGAVGAFFLTRYLFKKEMEKHPPIDENVIKAMYRSMGQTPSQARINQTMRAVKEAQKMSKNKK